MTKRRWWGLAALLVVLWLVAAAVVLLRAAGDLRAGRDAAREVTDDLEPAAVVEGAPLADLRAARDRFRSAADATRNPVLAPLRVLPVVGRQVRAIEALSDAGGSTAAVVADAVAGAARAVERRAPDGPGRLAQLRALVDTADAAARGVAAVDDLGPRRGLVAPLRDTRNELVEQLVEARRTIADAVTGLRAALRLLEGPTRYVLVAANPAEMRAGSGMWLSGGLLTAAGGELELGEVRPLYQLADPENDAVPIGDADLAARHEQAWHPNWDWRGLMPSPRVPASAELASRMWASARGEVVDGVLVVDPVTLAAIVKATGPLEIGDRVLPASQVVSLLVNGQYRGFDRRNAERRDRLGELASAAFEELDAGRWRTSTLVRELARAVRGRHLMAWGASEQAQQGWDALGMTGDLEASSLAVSVLNRGGNKLDWFLHGDASLHTARTARGTDVRLRLRFENRVPDGQPRYVTGPPAGQPWEAGRYVGVVSVNVPGRATAVRIEGAGPLVTEGPDGPTRVVSAELQVAAGATASVVVRFHLPPKADELVVESSGRVPPMHWRFGPNAWKDTRRRTVNI
jgi:hypothetical protein